MVPVGRWRFRCQDTSRNLWRDNCEIDSCSLRRLNLKTLAVQGPVVLKPESSGTVTVKSSSVYDKPVIDPK